VGFLYQKILIRVANPISQPFF